MNRIAAPGHDFITMRQQDRSDAMGCTMRRVPFVVWVSLLLFALFLLTEWIPRKLGRGRAER